MQLLAQAGHLTRSKTTCLLPANDCKLMCSSSYDIELIGSNLLQVKPTLDAPGDCVCYSGTGVANSADQVVVEFQGGITVTLDRGSGVGVFDAQIETSLGTCSATYATADKSSLIVQLLDQAGRLTRRETTCPMPADDCNMVCSSSYNVLRMDGNTLQVVPTGALPSDDCLCSIGAGVANSADQVVVAFEGGITVTLTIGRGSDAGVFHAEIETSLGTCSATYAAMPTADKSSGSLGIIIGGAAGGLVFIVAVVIAVVVILRRRRRHNLETLDEGSRDDVPMIRG